MRLTSCRGFTLVELLVVMAIMSILMAMMLPGIFACRESARRATCIHHLAQLGLALQNYEAAQEVLPPGVVNPRGPIRNIASGYHMSWVVHLLPYLEENVTYQHVDFSAGAYDKKNAPVREVGIALLMCPSENGSFAAAGRYAGSYAGCHHDVEAPIDKDNHGVFFLNSRLRSREIPDGASHTIYLGEKRLDDSDLGWISGTRSTLRNTGTPINEPLPEQDPEADSAGRNESEQRRVGGFGSAHAGVANFLFGDGAVRTVPQVIEPALYRQLGHRADGKLIKEPLP